MKVFAFQRILFRYGCNKGELIQLNVDGLFEHTLPGLPCRVFATHVPCVQTDLEQKFQSLIL